LVAATRGMKGRTLMGTRRNLMPKELTAAPCGGGAPGVGWINDESG
jgi:hypothetical protein